MSDPDFWRGAYRRAFAAMSDADTILAEAHGGKDCVFGDEGGDGCLACRAQSALMGYQTKAWGKADEAARRLQEADTPARRHGWARAVKRALGVGNG